MPEVSLESLYHQLHSRLLQFVVSRLPDSADAEDIVQEVFLRIHTNLDRVRKIDKLESWVYQIARNCIIDYYRSRKRLEPLVEFAIEDEHPEPNAAEELIPCLRDVVQELPEPYREALILTEYQGLSQQALADHLGISLSGAKSRVQRARQKVKDIMLTCCHFEFDMRGLICCYHERCHNCEESQLKPL